MKAILFDMDGVIIDSEHCWRKGTKELFQQYGIEYEPTEEIKEALFGSTARAGAEILINHYHLPITPERFIKERFMHVKRALATVNYMPGFREFYEEHRKVPKAIGTGSDPEIVDRIDEVLGIRRLFPIIKSTTEVGRGKPAPDIYLALAQELQKEPAECVVIEDSPGGIKAGKAAGMYVIGITTSFPAATLAAADQIVNTFDQIMMPER